MESLSGLDAHLQRARTLIGRAIRRSWSEGRLTRDPEGAISNVLSADQIESLISPRSRSAGPLLADVVPAADTPLGALARALDLLPTQIDLLAVLLACNLDPTANRLLGYLGGDQQRAPTMELLFEIVYHDRRASEGEAAALLHRDLAPQGFLRRMHIVAVENSDGRVALAQNVHLHQRVIAWLLQEHEISADLSAIATLHPPLRPEGEPDPAALSEAITALQSRRRLLLVEGPIRSGREMLLRFAAAQLGRPLLVVSGQGLGPARIGAAFREACLQGALLAFQHIDELMEGEGPTRLQECLEAYPETVALISAGQRLSRISALRPTVTVRVSVLPFGDRLRLWRDHLGECEISDDEMRQISALYNLGTSGIIEASRIVRELIDFTGPPLRRAHVSRAVRQLFDADLASVATRADVSQTWNDLVLPDDVAESVSAIIDRIRYRGEVMGDWGFARKLGKGLGLTVLFAGEPGTGKTMVAGLMAAELGLDLYVVDLSRIMSKWLGETEKNLARAFDAAEAGHVLLLFDEADSILGKRSADIRSSNDRHANLETNFILARLEQFQGVALFTTNLISAVDPAVLRRMSAQVHFPFPDPQTRAELWRRMIPDETPIVGEIDFDVLADRFELSGGFIRNIVLRAAFDAVRHGSGLSMQILSHAAEMEYRERGSLLIGGRLA